MRVRLSSKATTTTTDVRINGLPLSDFHDGVVVAQEVEHERLVDVHQLNALGWYTCRHTHDDRTYMCTMYTDTHTHRSRLPGRP